MFFLFEIVLVKAISDTSDGFQAELICRIHCLEKPVLGMLLVKVGKLKKTIDTYQMGKAQETEGFL